jgi:hypothetical protein
MKKYTAEEIKELTTVNRWVLRKCGICNSPLSYHISPDRTQVVFDPSCDCVRGGGWERSSWQDIADHINMQTNDEYRERCIRGLKGEKA